MDISLWAMPNPLSFRYFKTSPEIIQLAVMLYVRFPLSVPPRTPARMAEADAVLMMIYGSLSALVGAYFGFLGVAAKK
jgi:hypothetical protein